MALTPETRATKGAVLAAATSGATPNERVSKASLLAAINFPSIGVRATRAAGLVAATGLSGEARASRAAGLVAAFSSAPSRVTRAAVLVAAKDGLDERGLRAWTFTQDNHDFYVLLLGGKYTYVFDKTTGQWSQWSGPDFSFFRGLDGCDWNGFNVCCDPIDGTIWKLDPVGRLDYGTTPITSQVFAVISARFRKMVPVFMAELAVSEGAPPSGFPAGSFPASSVGVKLRTSDTVNLSPQSASPLGWTDHGSLAGQPIGSMTYFRWYGLGLAQSPGILFELTDTGYARRIDGFTVEFGAAVEAAIAAGNG